MADFSVNSLASRIFNTSKHENNVARNSNPVGQTVTTPSFTGKNLLQKNMRINVLSADVFETTNSNSIISKTKRMCSTFVGSINDMGTRFTDSIGAFCHKVKNNVSNFWTMLNETRVPGIIDASRAIKAKWDAANYAKDVQKYAAKPTSELKELLVNELSFNTAA